MKKRVSGVVIENPEVSSVLGEVQILVNRGVHNFYTHH